MIGGKYCQTPFRDPLFRKRSVLAQNEVFGTRNCYSGYEGLVDKNDMFSSCHLKIFEPSFFVRHTRAIISSSILSGIGFCFLAISLWNAMRRKERQRQKERRQKERQQSNVGQNALLFAHAIRQKQS